MREQFKVDGYTQADLHRAIKEIPANAIVIFEETLMGSTVNTARAMHGLLAKAEDGNHQVTILVDLINHMLLYGILMGQNGLAAGLQAVETDTVH